MVKYFVDNQVEEVKKKLDIVNVISKYLPLKKRGRNFWACCPFHGEKTPSFTVSPELQIFKCFGCGKSGDIFTFVEEYEHIEFRDALEDLAKIAGITLTKSPSVSHEESRQKTLITINTEVAKFYHYMLISHPLGKPALDYVLNRGISLSTINQFKIGYAPENRRLLVNFLLKKGFKIDDLIATGTFGQSQYGSRELYDRFLGRLIFPLADFRDRILGFSGRILPTASNPNLAKYINSPETDIYHKSHMVFGLNLSKDAIREANAVIITEGEFDMVSPFQSGIKNIIALKGTAFTQDQLQLLHRYTDTLILALDSDFAGNNAAVKSIELADSMGFDIKVLDLLEKYKDPDEAVKSDLPFFRRQLDHAIPVWDFIINSAVKSHDITAPKGKREVLAATLPFLVKISNSVIRSDYFKKLADSIASDLDSVIQESAKYLAAKPAHPVVSTDKPIASESQSTEDKYHELLLTLILGSKKPPALAKKMEKYLHNLARPAFQAIAAQLLAVDEFEPLVFQDSLPAEIRPLFYHLYITADTLNLDSKKRLEEIKKTVNLIQVMDLKKRIGSLSRQIADLENADDNTSLQVVELEYNRLLQHLSKLQVKKG